MNKDITLVSMYFPPDKNGMAVYTQKLYRFLLQNGWSVRLITRRRARKVKDQSIIQVSIPSIPLEEWGSQEIGRDPRTYSLQFSRGVHCLLSGREKLIHYLVCWDDYLMLYSAIAKGLKGRARLIMTIGGGGQRTPEELLGLRRTVLDKADVITFFSKQARRELVRIGVKIPKLIFTPPVVDTTKFYPASNNLSQKRTLRVIYLGRINRKKGVFDIVKVAQSLRGYPFRFFLIGEGIDKTLVKRKITMLGLDNVQVLPGIEHRDTPQVLRKSDIFLHPTYDDEFPVAVLEALACGLPCISTPIGEIPGIVKHGKSGFLVKPGDIQEICRCLLVMRNPKKRRILGREGRRISKKYDERKLLPRWREIYAGAPR